MISEYEEHLISIQGTLSQIDMALTTNEDYVALFQNPDGWVITFEGERYYRPLVDISISPPVPPKQKYSVRILMDLFQHRVGIKPSTYNLTDQVEFLLINHSNIFISPQPYANEYLMANEII